jgi:hypothetical protein
MGDLRRFSKIVTRHDGRFYEFALRRLNSGILVL